MILKCCSYTWDKYDGSITMDQYTLYETRVWNSTKIKFNDTTFNHQLNIVKENFNLLARQNSQCFRVFVIF